MTEHKIRYTFCDLFCFLKRVGHDNVEVCQDLDWGGEGIDHKGFQECDENTILARDKKQHVWPKQNHRMFGPSCDDSRGDLSGPKK